SATWRDSYLVAAQELRHGPPKILLGRGAGLPLTTLEALSTEQLWDFLSVRVDATRAEGKRIVIDWSFTDSKEIYALTLENCTLSYLGGLKSRRPADASFVTTRAVLNQVVARKMTMADAFASGEATCEGDPEALTDLMALMDHFPLMFDIAGPARPS